MSALNLLVFRGEQRRVSGQELKAVLARRLELLCGHDAWLGALLLAGEVECGLADAGHAAPRVELLTDSIAK